MPQNKITRMRYERIKNGWSLEYVADYLGITNQAVSKIELLKTQNPSYDILVKLENMFGLTHRQLFMLIDDDLTENKKGFMQRQLQEAQPVLGTYNNTQLNGITGKEK